MSGGKEDKRRRTSNGSTSASVVQYTRRVNEQSHLFDGWRVTLLKSSILPSNCYCSTLDQENTKGLLLGLGTRLENVKLPSAEPPPQEAAREEGPLLKCHVCRYTEELSLKHLPDMVFPDNYLHLHHEPSGLVLEFNTLDALRTISNQDIESIRVACAEAWQASKVEMGLPNQVLHDYNWTFSTDYRGTLKTHHGGEPVVVADPPEQLNIEKLKLRETILFYDELTLFEDELHDSGLSNLSVKVRAMPSGFFILLRHAIRVDHVMAKICDTRIHYETGNNYFLRQFQTKQESFKNLGELDPHEFADINALAQTLPVTMEVTEKMMLQ